MIVYRYLGDVLLNTPVACSLMEAGYRVDWLVAAGSEGIIQGQPYAERILTLDRRSPWAVQVRSALSLFRRYDRVLVNPADDRPMSMALAASSSRFAVIDSNRRQDAWKRLFCKAWVDYAPHRHRVAVACDLALAAGLPPCRVVRLSWDEADEARVVEVLGGRLGHGFALFHPFARRTYKWWPASAWRELIRRATGYGLPVAITGSEAETEAARKLAAGFPAEEARVLAGLLNWRQLACLSARARVYVGLDTANTHLAAASGTPVVALYGPTDPRPWGPWPNGYEGGSPWAADEASGLQRRGDISLIQGRENCVPCHEEGCERHRLSPSRCLEGIHPERVWREVLYRLGRPGGS